MTQSSEVSRIDALEALGQTTLLAIRELANRQGQTQQQLDQTQQQLDQTQQQLDQTQQQLDQLQQTVRATAQQQAANAEQIAANTAGLVELRNIVADFIRAQNR